MRWQIHGGDFCLLAKAVKVTWQPLIRPAPSPQTKAANKEIEGTGRSGRENYLVLPIILWLEAAVPARHLLPSDIARATIPPPPPPQKLYNWYS